MTSRKRVYNARTLRVHTGNDTHVDVCEYAFWCDSRRVAMGTVETTEGPVDVVLKLCSASSHTSTTAVMQSEEYAVLGRSPGVDVPQYAIGGRIDQRKARGFDPCVAANAHIETQVRGVTLEHAWKLRSSEMMIRQLREAYRSASTMLGVFTVGLVDMEHVSTASKPTTNEEVLLDPRVHVDLSIPAERAVLYRALHDALCSARSKTIIRFIHHVLQDADSGGESTGYLPRGTGAWGPSESAVRATCAAMFPTERGMTGEEVTFAFLVVPAVCRLAKACTDAGVYPHDARLSNIMVRVHGDETFV